MSEHEHESNHHGHSVAMWTAVIILLIAFGLMSIAVVIANHFLFWASAALALVGVIAGVALSKAGYGAEKLLPPGQAPADGSGDESPLADVPEGTESRSAGIN
ncbi:HGxxPAAW family protein [Actinomycetota bacterium]